MPVSVLLRKPPQHFFEQQCSHDMNGKIWPEFTNRNGLSPKWTWWPSLTGNHFASNSDQPWDWLWSHTTGKSAGHILTIQICPPFSWIDNYLYWNSLSLSIMLLPRTPHLDYEMVCLSPYMKKYGALWKDRSVEALISTVVEEFFRLASVW